MANELIVNNGIISLGPISYGEGVTGFGTDSIVPKSYVDSVAGVTGPAGATGPQGDVGATGPAGATGSSGLNQADNGLKINDFGVVIMGGTISTPTVIDTQSFSFSIASQFGLDHYNGFAVEETASLFGYYSTVTYSRILAQPTSITMGTSDGTNAFQLIMNQNQPASFNDTFYNKGIEYSGSYSGNFTTHSLVDKFYVDTQISSATYGLSSVLSVDNYAGANSIRMGNGTIQSVNNLSSIKVSDSTITLTTDKLEHDGNLENASNHIYSMRSNQTSNATPLNIFTFSNNDFGSPNAAISFDIIVNGYCETSSEGYFSKLFAGFICIGSTISQVGTTSQTQLSNFTSSVTSTISTDGSIISIQLTGETGKTINWCSRFNYQWAT